MPNLKSTRTNLSIFNITKHSNPWTYITANVSNWAFISQWKARTSLKVIFIIPRNIRRKTWTKKHEESIDEIFYNLHFWIRDHSGTVSTILMLLKNLKVICDLKLWSMAWSHTWLCLFYFLCFLHPWWSSCCHNHKTNTLITFFSHFSWFGCQI